MPTFGGCQSWKGRQELGPCPVELQRLSQCDKHTLQEFWHGSVRMADFEFWRPPEVLPICPYGEGWERQVQFDENQSLRSETVSTITRKLTKRSASGVYLPLSVYAKQGYDTKPIEEKAEWMESALLLVRYKVATKNCAHTFKTSATGCLSECMAGHPLHRFFRIAPCSGPSASPI